MIEIRYFFGFFKKRSDFGDFSKKTQFPSKSWVFKRNMHFYEKIIYF